MQSRETLEKYSVMTKVEAERYLEEAVRRVRTNLKEFTDRFPDSNSRDQVYPPSENVEWTTGFWTGEIWLAYERTGESCFREAGLRQVQSFLQRIEQKIDVDHHDMGFLYTPSCVAAYLLTGDESAKKAALLAADQLIGRFQEKGQFFQAWGIYGSALSYRFLKDTYYLDVFRKLCTFFLTHLPQDLVPYWDFDFDDGSTEPRDSSAAAIAACGMLEMARHLEGEEKAYYEGMAARLLKALCQHCAVQEKDQSNGLLLHGTYARASAENPCSDRGVDECNTWGDYYYMEALTHVCSDWRAYWDYWEKDE